MRGASGKEAIRDSPSLPDAINACMACAILPDSTCALLHPSSNALNLHDLDEVLAVAVD